MKTKYFNDYYNFQGIMKAINKWYNETSTFNNCISIMTVHIESTVLNKMYARVEYFEIDTTEYDLKEN